MANQPSIDYINVKQPINSWPSRAITSQDQPPEDRPEMEKYTQACVIKTDHNGASDCIMP